MKLNDKDIINEIGNYDYIKLLPSKNVMYLSSVLIIKHNDKYSLVKNRWSSQEKGGLYVNNMELNNIHVKELEYTIFKYDELLKVINGDCKLRDEFINNKFILFER